MGIEGFDLFPYEHLSYMRWYVFGENQKVGDHEHIS